MGDTDFKVISVPENSNKFQKTRFRKEKSVEDVVTRGPTAQATLVPSKEEEGWIHTLWSMYVYANDNFNLVIYDGWSS